MFQSHTEHDDARSEGTIGPFRALALLAGVVVVVAAVTAGGMRGFGRANSDELKVAQPRMAALAVIAEAPQASSEALVATPVSVALERQAEARRLAEEKQKAMEAAVLPERGVWNGSSPLPGSVVVDMMSMPMLEDESAPVVALTFDDGPSEFTAEIVSILEQEDVPATFFFLGANARNRPDDAKLVADAGFSVASHTMDHKDLKTLSPAAAEAQLVDSTALLDDLLGEGTVQCARPPYGSFNDSTLQAAKKLGLGLVNWDVDTLDWKVRDSGSILAKATVPGQRQLILMHDGGGPRTATVAALPGIISHYKAQGARFIELCADGGGRGSHKSAASAATTAAPSPPATANG